MFELGYLKPKFHILFMLSSSLAIGSERLALGRNSGMLNAYVNFELMYV